MAPCPASMCCKHSRVMQCGKKGHGNKTYDNTLSPQTHDSCNAQHRQTRQSRHSRNICGDLYLPLVLPERCWAGNMLCNLPRFLLQMQQRAVSCHKQPRSEATNSNGCVYVILSAETC
jgi:hypothetical protein